MLKYAPVAGLLMASPVVVDALRGRRSVDDALLVLVIGILVAAVGLRILSTAIRMSASPVVADDDAADMDEPGVPGDQVAGGSGRTKGPG